MIVVVEQLCPSSAVRRSSTPGRGSRAYADLYQNAAARGRAVVFTVDEARECDEAVEQGDEADER